MTELLQFTHEAPVVVFPEPVDDTLGDHRPDAFYVGERFDIGSANLIEGRKSCDKQLCRGLAYVADAKSEQQAT